LNEQIQIAAHLSKMTQAFEQLDRSLVRQVELLQERRQALITAAVTGKIDVRGEEA
jgi:type I restriction enzyme S subunit